MSEPTKEQIAKLPKWAQEHIAAIERERDGANGILKKFNDSQTPSPFFLDAWYCEPRIKRFIQSPTNNMTIEHAGVQLQIYLAPQDDGQREFGIEIQFSPMKPRLGVSGVAIIPKATNTVALVAKENMR